jgi:hypothetical protein
MMLCKGRFWRPFLFQAALSSKIQNGAGNLDNREVILVVSASNT